MKKQKTNFLFLMLLIPLFFIGCQKSELVDDSKTSNPESDGSGSLKSTIIYCGTPLVTGLVNFEQTINAGTVTIGNDATNLYVTIEATGDWWMSSSALYVGPVGQVPGYINPDGTGHFEVWNFPYYYEPGIWIKSYTYVLELSSLEDCFLVIPAVSVKNTLTNVTAIAWAKNLSKIPGFWVQYCKQTCPPPTTCETAYAYGGEPIAKCFLNIPGVTSNNWGWSNGLIGAGTYTWPIYAGAGQCNIGNGVHVGNLIVNFTPPTAVITYSMIDGFVLNATHLYVGAQILPMKKGVYITAPGQFPYQHGTLNGVVSDSFTISGLPGSIYIAAHSEACGNY